MRKYVVLNMVCLVNLVLSRSIQGPSYRCSIIQMDILTLVLKTNFMTSVITLIIVLGRMVYKVPNLVMIGGLLHLYAHTHLFQLGLP